MKLYESLSGVIAAFLSSQEDGSFERVTFTGNDLFVDGNQFGKITKDKKVLLSHTSKISDEINDAVLSGIISSGRSFTRIQSFDGLLNIGKLSAFLDNGKIDEVLTAASVYDVEVSPALIDDLTAVSKIRAEFEAKVAAAQESYEVAKASLLAPFEALQKEFAKRKALAEEAKQSEAAKKLNARWDAGENMSGYGCVGAGGGQRLRTMKRGGAQERIDVQGSREMYRTSLNTFRTVFNMVAPYVWGNKAEEMTDAMKKGRYRNFSVGSTRSHNISVSVKDYDNPEEKTLHMGCQNITVPELERFALSQGWPIDGSPATA